MIEAAGSIQLWSMDPSRLVPAGRGLHRAPRHPHGRAEPAEAGDAAVSTPRVAPTRRPMVQVRLTTDGTWLLSCRHCDGWAYVAHCRSDADDHARWHRDAHKVAARAER